MAVCGQVRALALPSMIRSLLGVCEDVYYGSGLAKLLGI